MDIMDIMLFVSDVDSTLTDGKYHVSDDGSISKSFFTRDFYAMEQLLKNYIDVLICTSSRSGIIYNRVEKLPYDLNVMNGVLDKKKEIEKFLKRMNLTWENVAYIGDAENDLECMKVAGLTCCPKDAIPDVKNVVDFVSEYDGGNGAVWEFANYVLKLKKQQRG